MTYSLAQQASVIVGAVELYEFDFGEGVVEYFCTARKPIKYDWGLGDGEVTYEPLAIGRSAVKNAGQASPDTLAVSLPTRPSFVGMLGKGSVSRLQVRIIRGFGKLTAATESRFLRYWFVGNLFDLSVDRSKTQANLRTLEAVFRETLLPRISYQSSCNNALFHGDCAALKSDFSFTFDLREVLEDGTLVRVNVNPATQNPSGTQSYDPEDHVQLGDGSGSLPSDYGGIGYYTLGKVWRDSLPTAPRHILAHTYLAGDGSNQCRFKILAPLPTLETDQSYEGVSNNLVLSSEEPTASADWDLLNGCAATLYAGPGPSFGSKASLVSGTGTASPILKQTIAAAGFSNGATYSYAMWLRNDDALESDIILISSDSPADIFRVKIEWLNGPRVTLSAESEDYIGLTYQLEDLGDGWFVFQVDFDWFTADGDILVELIPDSDTGGADDKGVFFYAAMVKNGSGLTTYEANQTVWMTAHFGCQKTGFPCGDKFDQLNSFVAFPSQPTVHPVLTGFRRP